MDVAIAAGSPDRKLILNIFLFFLIYVLVLLFIALVCSDPVLDRKLLFDYKTESSSLWECTNVWRYIIIM